MRETAEIRLHTELAGLGAAVALAAAQFGAGDGQGAATGRADLCAGCRPGRCRGRPREPDAGAGPVRAGQQGIGAGPAARAEAHGIPLGGGTSSGCRGGRRRAGTVRPGDGDAPRHCTCSPRPIRSTTPTSAGRTGSSPSRSHGTGWPARSATATAAGSTSPTGRARRTSSPPSASPRPRPPELPGPLRIHQESAGRAAPATRPLRASRRRRGMVTDQLQPTTAGPARTRTDRHPHGIDQRDAIAQSLVRANPSGKIVLSASHCSVVPQPRIITRQAIRRGSFDSVPELITAIRTFIEGWNDRCHPFTWTKTADEILPHATRKRDSDARH